MDSEEIYKNFVLRVSPNPSSVITVALPYLGLLKHFILLKFVHTGYGS